MKRSGKFYRKNEAEVMSRLGFKPTKNSGAGWIEKEDGQNDYLICQLKSTDKSSIKINKKDIDILNLNAEVAHKLPVFAVQFIQSDDVYLLVKPDLLQEIANFIDTGFYKPDNNILGLDINNLAEDEISSSSRVIKSSKRCRDIFYKEKEAKFKKEKKAK